jgi:DNA-binding response OmpR family regulator
MSGHPKETTVLVVDDEPDVADLYAYRLGDSYDVRVANDGETALDELDESVDVVLLDRRMPGLSGDEVLTALREANYDCRVIMVTAVDPDVDIVDMAFDDYVCKPVGQEELLAAVEQQLTAKRYSDSVQALFRATSKMGVLRAERSLDDLENTEEYQRLEARIEELRAKNTELLDELDDFEAAFNAIDPTPPDGGQPEEVHL